MTMYCVYVALSGIFVVLIQNRATPAVLTHTKIANASIVYCIGALVWPFAWSLVIGSSISSMPWFAYVGLVWPPILLLVDVVFAQHHAGIDPVRQTQGMQIDANTLSGLALTLGAVLVRNVSNGFADAAGPMMIATVLVALLFLVPTPMLHVKSIHAATIRASQKVALQYCLGFTLTAVAIAFGVGIIRAPVPGEELQKVMNGRVSQQFIRK